MTGETIQLAGFREDSRPIRQAAIVDSVCSQNEGVDQFWSIETGTDVRRYEP